MAHEGNPCASTAWKNVPDVDVVSKTAAKSASWREPAMSEQTRRSWKTVCCSQSAAVHMRSAVATSVKPISWIIVNRVTDGRVRYSDYATAKDLLGRSSVVSRASRNMLGCWTKHHMTCLGLLRQQNGKVANLMCRGSSDVECNGPVVWGTRT